MRGAGRKSFATTTSESLSPLGDRVRSASPPREPKLVGDGVTSPQLIYTVAPGYSTRQAPGGPRGQRGLFDRGRARQPAANDHRAPPRSRVFGATLCASQGGAAGAQGPGRGSMAHALQMGRCQQARRDKVATIVLPGPMWLKPHRSYLCNSVRYELIAGR
jgi:hypothetical protein